MAKFTGKSQTASFDSVSVTCITSIEYDDSVDTFMTDCASSAGIKSTVTGLRQISGTVDLLIEADDVTEFNNYQPGDSGAWSHNPTGASPATGDILITATTATVVSRSLSVPSNGLVAVSVELNFDDMTIAASA